MADLEMHRVYIFPRRVTGSEELLHKGEYYYSKNISKELRIVMNCPQCGATLSPVKTTFGERVSNVWLWISTFGKFGKDLTIDRQVHCYRCLYAFMVTKGNIFITNGPIRA